jgi:signal transduction histidine kinase
MVTNNKGSGPVVLKSPISRSRPWTYILIGALLGAIIEVAVFNPMEFFLQKIFDYVFLGADIQPELLIRPNIFKPAKWPGITLTGIIFGGLLGFIFQRLKEQRRRIQTLHREFELRVATLRHHYKNLAVGIHGFSSRIKRKLADLHGKLTQAEQPEARFDKDIEILEQNVAILEEAAQRLTQTLGDELLFLRALTSDTLHSMPQDIYPFLRHTIQDLLGLRFQEKQIKVEINDHQLDAEQGPLTFSFEPYTMEVILQNILSNAMKYGDHIQVQVAPAGGWVRMEVQDNGPGVDVDKLKQHLLTPGDKRGAESTHLGLQVTMHLLEKTGGRLSVQSEPGRGAKFILEFPK